MQVNGYEKNALLVGSLRFPIAFAEFKPQTVVRDKEQNPKKKCNRRFRNFRSFCALSFFFVF